MDYVTNRLSAEEHKRIEQHLQECSLCNNYYNDLLAAHSALEQNHNTAPTSVYYSTILPRVRERLIARQRSMWDFSKGVMKIILPLLVSILLIVLLIKTPTTDNFSESGQTEALHQAVMDLNEEEVVQAVEKEYTGLSLSPNQEVAAAGVAEHLQGDRFLKSAVSKQIENEEIVEMDIEEMISNLNKEQVDKLLSGLTERNVL